MFERSIGRDEVTEVLQTGQVIAHYAGDEPLPSYLLLGVVGGRRLHVVVGVDDGSKTCYIITAYDPDPDLWDPDFRIRRPK